MAMFWFHLVVEGPSWGPDRDWLSVSQPALRLDRLRWETTDDGDATPPDIITLEGGTVLIRVGMYLAGSADGGGTHRYRVATAARLIDGRLVPVLQKEI